MDNIIVKLKRGAVRQQDNYIFFQYNRIGKEIWLTPEIYKLKRDKEILKRREKRKKKKLINTESKNNKNLF